MKAIGDSKNKEIRYYFTIITINYYCKIVSWQKQWKHKQRQARSKNVNQQFGHTTHLYKTLWCLYKVAWISFHWCIGHVQVFQAIVLLKALIHVQDILCHEIQAKLSYILPPSHKYDLILHVHTCDDLHVWRWEAWHITGRDCGSSVTLLLLFGGEVTGWAPVILTALSKSWRGYDHSSGCEKEEWICSCHTK